MSIDLDRLKNAVPIEQLIESYGVELKKSGSEFVACCPFHDEKTPSFTVTPDKDTYHCFGCGAGGDHIQFVQDMDKVDFKLALEKLQNIAGGSGVDLSNLQPVQRKAATRPRDIWEPIIPVPENAPKFIVGKKTAQIYNPKKDKSHSYEPELYWEYSVGDDVWGYVFRFTINGEKITPQVTYCRHKDTGEEQWVINPMPEPRPLYGYNNLTRLHESEKVIVPEGEKAADAADRLLGKKLPVVSWCGGGKGFSKTDWSPLAGKEVFLLRDNDAAGLATCEGYWNNDKFKPGIGHILLELGCKVWIVNPPEYSPESWDIADEINWKPKDAIDYIKAGKVLFIPAEPAEVEPPPIEDVPPELPPEYFDEQFENDQVNDLPFRPLGYSNDDGSQRYHFFSYEYGTIISLSSGGLVAQAQELAPFDWWRQRGYVKDGSDKFREVIIKEYLMGMSKQVGPFRENRVRKVGAWLEGGKPLFHTGDQIIIDDKRYPIRNAPETENIYVLDGAANVTTDNPLGNQEAKLIADICEGFSWQKETDGRLLAGWIVNAIICGALNWRPHIWITGDAGSGKSTLIETVIRPLLSEISLNVQSKSTEPGIRNALNFTARPVIFDEAESPSRADATRIDAVLDLLVQASSRSSGRIYKSVQGGGKATAFEVNSCFCLSSINPNLKLGAAQTRTSVLSLNVQDQSPENIQRFDNLQRLIVDTLTPEYIARFQARAIRLIPVINENQQIFKRAALKCIKSARGGDQLSTLLAGCYSLFSTKVIDENSAIDWIRSRDWSDTIVTEKTEGSDSNRLLAFILDQDIRVQPDHGHTVYIPVGELVQLLACAKTESDVGVGHFDAEKALERHGMKYFKVDGRAFLGLKMNHNWFDRILKDRAWTGGAYKIISRIPGVLLQKQKRLAGSNSRLTCIPVDFIYPSVGEDPFGDEK